MNGDGARILVIGGGIAGMTAALEAAEAGCRVILIEKSPWLGGRVAQMHQYFPKLCPPACGLEINFKRIKNNPNITVLTMAELEELAGSPGEFEATVKIAPRYVKESCTACGACVPACPAERVDEFNCGIAKTKAVHVPNAFAFPSAYAIDRAACPQGCAACTDACSYQAIDLAQQPERKKFRVASVVAATGWEPYDARRIENLGFGKYPNVVTNLMLERMAARDGPAGGKILRPSDGKEPKSVAFVQCAGSRDENHLPYCSGVCCAASLKQVTYLRALYPDAAITVFYIDLRTPGLLEDFLSSVSAQSGVQLVKGKIAKVDQDPETGNLCITAEDVLRGAKATRQVEMLVLATGLVPRTNSLPRGFVLDEFGFVGNGAGKPGFAAAGCVRRPSDVAETVRDATGAALRAFQWAARSARHAEETHA